MESPSSDSSDSSDSCVSSDNSDSSDSSDSNHSSDGSDSSDQQNIFAQKKTFFFKFSQFVFSLTKHCQISTTQIVMKLKLWLNLKTQIVTKP